MVVERMSEDLNMAANTKELPRMDLSISGAFKTMFIMTKLSRELLSWMLESSSSLLLLFIVTAINLFSIKMATKTQIFPTSLLNLAKLEKISASRI